MNMTINAAEHLLGELRLTVHAGEVTDRLEQAIAATSDSSDSVRIPEQDVEIAQRAAEFYHIPFSLS